MEDVDEMKPIWLEEENMWKVTEDEMIWENYPRDQWMKRDTNYKLRNAFEMKPTSTDFEKTT